MEQTLYTLDELKPFAESFCKSLSPQTHATVVFLSGDLGSGKTTFVQLCGRFFGIEENITSPTFVIQKEYSLEQHNFRRFVHIDAYRLERKEELEYLGWKDLVNDPHTIIFLEWPEKIAGIHAPDAVHLSFAILEGDARMVHIKK